MPTRRAVLSGMAAAVGGGLAGVRAAPATEEERVVHTDAEWRKLLTGAQYAVLRMEGTEPPFTSPLLHETRRGTFACAGCGLSLFSSSDEI